MDIIKKGENSGEDPYSSYESFLRKGEPKANDPRRIEIVESAEERKKRKLARRILRIIIFSIIASAFIWGAYFAFKIGSMSKKVSIRNEDSSVIKNVGSLISTLIPKERKILKGEEEGRINILLLGAAGKGNPGPNLTDTIMIAGIDINDKRASLFSLPRDLYANIHETSYYTKINSIYQYGMTNSKSIEPIKKTVEEITGIPIHYFVVLDFEGFKKIVNDIGGINVTVERDIYDSRYPGPNYSYETFEIKKGTYLMNGETALKYVRERHDDPEGDFGRAKRQQKVMQAAKNKIFSLGTFLNPVKLNNLLTDLGDNIKTDIKIEDIESFIELGKKLDTQNVVNAVADAWEKDSILKVSHVFAGGSRAFVLVPRVGNYSEIQELMQNIFDLDSIRRRKSEIGKENASITIIDQSKYFGLGYKIKDILENKLGTKNIKVVNNAAASDSQKSYIFDNTNGQKIFTLDEIIKKLDIELNSNKNAMIERQKSDLVLLLGNDLENIGSFEEDSIEEFKKAEEKQEYFELIKK